jgi:hypothetical protein
MRSDVRRWARGDLSCADGALTKGWDAQQKAPEPEVPKPPMKSREHHT